ncbi:Hypothetical predicted protein [Marmota monax]|uniref:Uncharacterized protein n=1 Tax=Marmota monax TaxID=9995 RepID=A0A5E4AC15_MARMO|nr:Hypothetical predicted protein [Marmota monax]
MGHSPPRTFLDPWGRLVRLLHSPPEPCFRRPSTWDWRPLPTWPSSVSNYVPSTRHPRNQDVYFPEQDEFESKTFSTQTYREGLRSIFPSDDRRTLEVEDGHVTVHTNVRRPALGDPPVRVWELRERETGKTNGTTTLPSPDYTTRYRPETSPNPPVDPVRLSPRSGHRY